MRRAAASRGRCAWAAAWRCAWCARRPACVARRGGRRPVTQRQEAQPSAREASVRNRASLLCHLRSFASFARTQEQIEPSSAKNRRDASGRMLRRVKCRFKGSEGKERRAQSEPAGCDRIAVCSWRGERCSRPGELVSPSSASSRAVESLDSKHSCSSVWPSLVRRITQRDNEIDT